jgi:two-component system, NarL family, invasion response regulator UvrY
MTNNIRVLLVDDHLLFREGLKFIIAESEDVAVSAEAGSAADAIKLARTVPAEVMLLDISMPDRNGHEIIRQLKKEAPQMRILILSMHREGLYAVRSIKAGAAGYLNKQCGPDELLGAIRQVASGRRYISPALAQELADHVSEDREAVPHESLSDREYQTFTMIASGKAVGDIAAELNLSVKTVSMYRARLLEKMNLRNNAEITHYAIRNRLID